MTMYGAQPSEYTEYGDNDCGSSDYSHENGHNEFSYYPGIYTQQGPTTLVSEYTPIFPTPARRKHGAHAKNNMRRLEQDRAVALEAERAEIIMAMFKLSIFTGHRAVTMRIAETFRPDAED